MTDSETKGSAPEGSPNPSLGNSGGGSKPIAPVYMLLIVVLLAIMGFQVYLIFKNLSNKPTSTPVAGGQNLPPVGAPPSSVPAPGGAKMPPPSGAPGQPPTNASGTPMGPVGALFGALVTMNGKDDLKLTADQKTKMAAMLQSNATNKAAFVYFKTVVEKTLTADQLEQVKAGSMTPPPPVNAAQTSKPVEMSDPTWTSTLAAVAAMVDKKPEDIQPATVPAGGDTAEPFNTMNGAAYARGILSLARTSKSTITKQEAEALLPALKAAVNADAAESRLKKEVVSVLNDKQKAFLLSYMQPIGQNQGSGGSMPMLAGADQVLYIVTDGKEGSKDMPVGPGGGPSGAPQGPGPQPPGAPPASPGGVKMPPPGGGATAPPIPSGGPAIPSGAPVPNGPPPSGAPAPQGPPPNGAASGAPGAPPAAQQ